MNLFNPTKRAELIARVNLLTPESKTLWGKMSVGEMVCHCLDGLLMATGRRNTTDASNFFMRSLVKYLVIYIIPIPKGATAASEINPLKQGTKPLDFDNDRQLLVTEVRKFGECSDAELHGKHYLFGKLTPNQWRRLAYKHLHYHLKQFGV